MAFLLLSARYINHAKPRNCFLNSSSFNFSIRAREITPLCEIIWLTNSMSNLARACARKKRALISQIWAKFKLIIDEYRKFDYPKN